MQIRVLSAPDMRRELSTRDAVEIVNGDAPAGRGDRDFTLFESVGNAARDIAIAETAVARAEAAGLGVLAPL